MNTHNLGVESSWKKLEIQSLHNVHCGKWLIFLRYSSDDVRDLRVKCGSHVRQGIKGLMYVHEERIIVVVIHNDLNLPLQNSHKLLLAARSVASCFYCVPTTLSILYVCLLQEDQYQYIIKWSTSISIICRKQNKSFVHPRYDPCLL